MDDLPHHLSPVDEAIFRALQTHNFESVLLALRTTVVVLTSLGQDTRPIQERYVMIQRALADAVQAVHIPWSSAAEDRRRRIREALLHHKFVYSTNYDLLIYWAVMTGVGQGEQPQDFVDFFWSQCGERVTGSWVCFDESNASARQSPTKVLYVHGGLHLYTMPFGESAKRVAEPDQNLLSIFFQQAVSTDIYAPTPLLVAEGTAEEKKRAVAQSDYLSFCFRHLRRFRGPLVLFGHSLSEQDRHIVEAINENPLRDLAISVHADSADEVVRAKAHYVGLFPHAPDRLRFFDARTHPLGDPRLRIA
jgi:hypothetical protein